MQPKSTNCVKTREYSTDCKQQEEKATYVSHDFTQLRWKALKEFGPPFQKKILCPQKLRSEASKKNHP